LNPGIFGSIPFFVSLHRNSEDGSNEAPSGQILLTIDDIILQPKLIAVNQKGNSIFVIFDNRAFVAGLPLSVGGYEIGNRFVAWGTEFVPWATSVLA
jgi:hypothetical protein